MENGRGCIATRGGMRGWQVPWHSTHVLVGLRRIGTDLVRFFFICIRLGCNVPPAAARACALMCRLSLLKGGRSQLAFTMDYCL
jgi:hypothetical protein